MKRLELAFCLGLVCLAGCRVSGGRAAALKSGDIAKSLDHDLIGAWQAQRDQELTEFTYSASHRYTKRWGRAGFRTGFYQEDGEWDIDRGSYVELIPESRSNHVSNSDPRLLREVKSYERAMDEGAWKPVPAHVTIQGHETLIETLDYLSSAKPIRFRRVWTPI